MVNTYFRLGVFKAVNVGEGRPSSVGVCACIVTAWESN